MSIYNETEEQIRKSIQSILNQSFTDFELIIVNDNPNSMEYPLILKEYAKKDERIVIINNKTNLGLAKSMNKACSKAKSDILARMDADDIAMTNRLRLQFNQIKNDGIDLSFGRFISFDDESGNTLYESEYIDKKYIEKNLAFKSLIHHPTVMMTKECFYRAGQYRDFPCAQDYDLWLRIQETGARIAMTDNIILKYRIRSNSITSSKKIKQKLTQEYSRKLLIQRMMRKNKTDSFCKEEYDEYINKYAKNGKYDALAKRYDKYMLYHTKWYNKIKVILFSPIHRHLFVKLFMQKIIIKTLRGINR